MSVDQRSLDLGRQTGLEEAAALADSSAVTFESLGMTDAAKACLAVGERIRNWAAMSPAPPKCLYRGEAEDGGSGRPKEK